VQAGHPTESHVLALEELASFIEKSHCAQTLCSRLTEYLQDLAHSKGDFHPTKGAMSA
jgi:hypothetical protein